MRFPDAQFVQHLFVLLLAHSRMAYLVAAFTVAGTYDIPRNADGSPVCVLVDEVRDSPSHLSQTQDIREQQVI